MFSQASDNSFASPEIDPFAVVDSARGSVVRHPVLPRCYWVRGTECVYQVRAWRHGADVIASCPCEGFRHRRNCAHARAVAAYVRTERLCPACGGKGWLQDRPGQVWATPGPIVLVCCWGTGLRAEWDREGRHVEPGRFRNTYCPRPAAWIDEAGELRFSRQEPVVDVAAQPERPSVSWMPDEDVRRAMFA